MVGTIEASLDEEWIIERSADLHGAAGGDIHIAVDQGPFTAGAGAFVGLKIQADVSTDKEIGTVAEFEVSVNGHPVEVAADTDPAGSIEDGIVVDVQGVEVAAGDDGSAWLDGIEGDS